MAADDMADFVRDHALDFIRAGRGVDQSGVDIDGLAAGDERVHFLVVEQHDLDVVGRQPRGDDDRPHHVAEELLRLGVAQHGLRGGGDGAERERAGNQHRLRDSPNPPPHAHVPHRPRAFWRRSMNAE